MRKRLGRDLDLKYWKIIHSSLPLAVAFREVFLAFIFLYFSQDGGEGLFVWVFLLCF